MRTLVLILGREVQWAFFDGRDRAPVRTGTGAPPPDGAPERCWLMVPGTDVTAHAIQLPPEASERKVAAAAAFALEDALAEDPADLHFALGPAAAGKRLVVVARRAAMSAWLSRLTALGVTADVLLPDYLAVSKGPVTFEGTVLMRTAEGGFAAEPELAALVLDGGPSEFPSRSGADLLTDAYATLHDGAPVNLLQGAYARQRDWGALLRPWRRVGALAAGILIAGVAGLALEGLRLTREADAANARAEAVFRAALPDVKRVVNPRAQMRAYLQDANLTGSGFLVLSEVVVGAVAAEADAEITSLRFDAKRSEMTATFSLPSFEAVERLKSAIGGRGGLVQEGGARQDGSRVLADMTVRRP